MTGIVCAIVGNAVVTAVAQVIRKKLSVLALGNAQVDTAQSKFGGASVIFDGVDGTDLRVYDQGKLAYGTGDFTIEFWLRPTATGGIIWDQRPQGNLGAQPTIYMAGSTLTYYTNSGNRITGSTLSTNTWYHIALSRSGTSTKMFVDGTQVGSTYTDSTNYVSSTFTKIGGDQYDATGNYLNGHIDEVRVSNSARYTANFTAPTAPFTNDENTLLLLHMDGTDASTFFEDDNGLRLQRGVRAIGNAQVDTAQSKFGFASALFDGTGDYLIVAPKPNLTHTSSWTIECWIRAGDVTTSQAIIASFDTNSPFSGWSLEVQNGNFKFYDGSSFRIFNSSASTNTWYHIAIVSESGSMKMYQDGTQQTTTSTLGSNFNNTTNDFVIAAIPDGTRTINAHIDEVRISSTARYTANFTPSTTPFTNDADTLLLMHMDGTDASTVFRDDNGVGRASIGFSAIADAQVDTAQSKYGGASLLLDGTGDFLYSPSVLSLGTGDFTVECWIRVGSAQGSVVLDNRTSNVPGVFTIQSDSKLSYFDPAVGGPKTTGTYPTNTWFHACWERSGSTFKMYIDGVGSYTNNSFSSDLGTNRNIRIGISYADTAPLNGHIDEFRISNIARYNGDFTPSTEPFQNDSNTLLLLHMDGTDASKVFVDDNGTRPT